MKYVMFTNIKTGIRLPVLLPETIISHADASLGKDWVATSAGFASIAGETLNVSGESKSLAIKPTENDWKILNAVICSEATLMLFQDPMLASMKLEAFCKCGHCYAAHLFPEKRRAGNCSIYGCKCECFERIA